MKTALKYFAFSVLAFMVRAHAGDASKGWSPSPELIQRIDANATKIELPAEFGDIHNYYRYYAGVFDGDRRVVVGALLSAELFAALHMHYEIRVSPKLPDRVAIVSVGDLPGVADGGCMMVHVWADADTGSITDQVCNFDPRPPPPQH